RLDLLPQLDQFAQRHRRSLAGADALYKWYARGAQGAGSEARLIRTKRTNRTFQPRPLDKPFSPAAGRLYKSYVSAAAPKQTPPRRRRYLISRASQARQSTFLK